MLVTEVCYEQRDAMLKIHFEDGFMMTCADGDTKDVIIWQYPFSQLKKSSDDGSVLRLSFTDNEVKVREFCCVAMFPKY